MRYLGIDYGDSRIGISLSDSTNLIACSLTTLKNDELFFENLSKILIENKITGIVLGNPLNMDGTLSKKSESVFEFKKHLEQKFDIKVILQDERLTTVSAEKVLISGGIRRKNRKKMIDSVASSLILQSFLDKGVK